LHFSINFEKFSIAMIVISVTAVGGTEYVPEVAVYFSGGGFSDYVSALW